MAIISKTPTRLLVTERVVASHTDDILDFDTGAALFRAEGSALSRDGRRTITDTNGQLIYSLNYRNSLWSSKSGTVVAASGAVAMTLKGASRYSYDQTGTLADGTKFTYKEGSGGLRQQRSAEVRDSRGGLLARKVEAPVGLRKDGCFVWEVAPGSDIALMTMIALAADEAKSGSIRRDPNLLLYYH